MLVGEVFARMGLDDKQYKKGLSRLEGITQKKAMTLGSIFKGAFSFAIGIGVIQGFRSLGGAITDFVNTAARTEVLNVAMQSVAKSSGYVIATLYEQRKAVMELGIAEQEATQILTRFMQAQLDTADAAKLARVAQDAAVIAGYNSSQAAEQMTEAIAKQRPELLSAFGMTRNMNEIYNDYAKTVGKTRTQLSEAEKKQAMLNYILAEGEKIAGTYEASMGAVGKQISSLPRYWDTLKNAIAKPLALPVISVIVDGITNSLKNAISWAETNTSTLQRWGQTAANVAGFIIRAFQNVSRVFIENWAMIKIAGTALLTYAAVTKIAAGATAIFQAVSLVLNGQLTAQTPILGWVSTAMGIYKVQMALAAAQGIVLTGVLAKLRVALYSLWTALGPIGWAILLITGLVAGGMALWNKYTQSLQKAAQAASPVSLAAEGFRDLGKSAQKSADATEDQADALKEAGKAAGKNIQSFDEVHQLQEDMAGSAEDMALDVPELEDIGIPELPDMDLGDMMAGLEEGLEGLKPTLSGFWEWIKQGVRNLSDWLKEKTGLALWELLALATGPLGALVVLFSRHWDEIKKTVSVVWSEIWKLIKTYWNNWVELAADVFGAIWDYITGTWDNIKNATSAIWGAIWGFLKNQWETIRDFGSNIFGIMADLITGRIDLRTAIKRIWEEIKSFLFGTWNNIKSLGINIWTAISEFFKTQSELSKNLFVSIWTAIKEFIIGNWEAIKESATNIWTAVSGLIKNIWEDINDVVTRIATSILKFLGVNLDELKKTVSQKWADIRTTISTKWEEIKTDAFNWGRKIITAFTDGVKDRISKIKTTFSSVAGTIKDYLGFSSPTKEGPGRYADQWAPNLMKMYSKGLTSNISMMQDAASATIRDLAELDIGGATITGKQAGISPPAAASSGDMTLIVKIGEDTIMEKIISNINRKSRTRTCSPGYSPFQCKSGGDPAYSKRAIQLSGLSGINPQNRSVSSVPIP
jgi:hypothetical protein